MSDNKELTEALAEALGEIERLRMELAAVTEAAKKASMVVPSGASLKIVGDIGNVFVDGGVCCLNVPVIQTLTVKGGVVGQNSCDGCQKREKADGGQQ